MTKLYCVIYRTGGTKNFKWHRTLAMQNKEAFKAREEIECMGYFSYVSQYDQSVAIGLPETYSGNECHAS